MPSAAAGSRPCSKASLAGFLAGLDLTRGRAGRGVALVSAVAATSAVLAGAVGAVVGAASGVGSCCSPCHCGVQSGEGRWMVLEAGKAEMAREDWCPRRALPGLA